LDQAVRAVLDVVGSLRRNDGPGLQGDVGFGSELTGRGVYLQMVAERARMALCELAAMIKVEGKGRGLVHDRRLRLGDALVRNPPMTARGLAHSLRTAHQSAASAVRACSPPVWFRKRQDGRASGFFRCASDFLALWAIVAECDEDPKREAGI
jgi:hypothetical protein